MVRSPRNSIVQNFSQSVVETGTFLAVDMKFLKALLINISYYFNENQQNS